METQAKKTQKLFNKNWKIQRTTEMNSTINKEHREGINSRITEAEERIGEQEHRMVEITIAEQGREKEWKEIGQLWDLWDNIRRTNIHVKGVSEGKERERTWETVNIWRDNSQ